MIIDLTKFQAEMNKEKEEVGKKSIKAAKGSEKSKSFLTDERIKFVFGILVTGFALYLLLACVSYIFWWKTDLSLSNSDVISGHEVGVKNWSGKSGHFLAKMIIGYGFGYGAFFIPLIFGSIGLYLLNFPKIKPFRLVTKFTFAAIILSLILGFIFGKSNVYLGSGPGGAQGYLITRWMNAFMGMIGTGVLIAFITITYLVFALRVKPESFGLRLPAFLKFKKPEKNQDIVSEPDSATLEEESVVDETPEDEQVEFVVKNTNINIDPDDIDGEIPELLTTGSIIRDFDNDGQAAPPGKEVPINITRPDAGDTLS
ncbi:MAG: DNA translocase FtsK 4TM domain-containing protein, partial [Bacteroidales bacterium]